MHRAEEEGWNNSSSEQVQQLQTIKVIKVTADDMRTGLFWVFKKIISAQKHKIAKLTSGFLAYQSNLLCVLPPITQGSSDLGRGVIEVIPLMPVSHCCDSRWRMWEDSWKTLSLHPRVCSDCCQLPQSQLQKHIPSLCSWIENHSLLLTVPPSLCRVLLRFGQGKERSKCCPGETIPRPVAADYFDTWCKHSFYWCILDQEWFNSQFLFWGDAINSPHPPVQYWRRV